MGARISSIEIPHVGTFEALEQSRSKVEARTGRTFDNYEDLWRAFMRTLGVDLTLSSREWRARFELSRQYDESLAGMGEKEKAILQRLDNPESRLQMSQAMERL